MLHELKIKKVFFNPVMDEIKCFEIRKNDRNFKVGDKVTLREWDEDSRIYTGRQVNGEITYITDYEQKEGYIVFNFKSI